MRKLYMVGNTHFDPVWLWKWDEAMASIRATFRSALDRMDETPDFIYSFATPPVFEWIRNTDPKLFEDIKTRVKDGKWELPEGWWLQPDCYSGMGESYVRQGLYGQKYLKENFGIITDCVFNIDSFGHSPMLPQILKKSHIDKYCFVRPEKRHFKLEHPLFVWKGIDGTEILAYRAEEAYEKNLSETIEKQEEKEQDILIVYGVTDHGGAPTKKMLKEIEALENAEFSTVKRFFDEHETCDYVVDRELYTGDFGVYANHPKTKQLNRIAEYAVLNAEKASLIAGNYDSEKIENCWRDIMFNQFHDIIGGACIKEAYFDSRNVYGRAIANANEMVHYNLQTVTAKMKTVGSNPETIWNLVVWNLNTSEFNGFVEAEVQWAHEFDWYDKGIDLADEEGNIYPCQIIEAKAVIPCFRSRFVFKAQIPACGYKMYRLILNGKEPTSNQINPFEFSTDRLDIVFDKEKGTLKSVTDKLNGEKLCGETLVPRVYFDNGDTWAFNITRYDETPKDFEFKGIKVIEAGELRTILKATYKLGDSLLYMYYKFYQGETYFDVSYKVNFNEKHRVLKLETAVSSNKHIAAVPYGSIERDENAADMPLGAFVKSGKITLVSGGQFAYNMINKTLGITVLRSAIYGDLRIGDLDYEKDFDILSEGITEGAIRVIFGGDAFAMADSFCNPPIVIDECCHDGELPSTNCFARLEAQSASIGAIKKCEFSGDTVIRIFEHGGNSQNAMLYFKEKSYEVELAPFEIKTLLLKDGEIKEIFMTEDKGINGEEI